MSRRRNFARIIPPLLTVVALVVSLMLVNPETASAQEPPPDDYTMEDIWDTGSFGRVSVGSAGRGSIERSGDRDFFTVELSETGTYRIEVAGSGDADALANPRLYGVFRYAEDLECSGAYDDPAVRSYAFTTETTAAYTYSVGVRAEDDGTGSYRLTIAKTDDTATGCDTKQDSQDATPTPTSEPAPEPPGTPQDFQATAASHTQIDLSWTAPEGEPTSYQVEWSADGETNWQGVAPSHSGADTAYSHTGLTAETTYHYRVRGENDNGAGEWSETVSATTEERPNTPATGAPAISGTARVGEMLTADTSGIADEDGLTNASFSYQWQADGADISNATDSTYTLVDADEGKAVSVTVSFTDDAGNEEMLTSAATELVADRSNTPATGAPTISGTAQVGETLTAHISGISDADGLDNAVFNYQWQADGADIPGATASTYIPASSEEGNTISVRVSFTDDRGHSESLTSAATGAVEAKPNTPATGLPSITGTARVGETLTADTSGIADADGLTNVAYSYQWLADGADLSLATDATYTLAVSDEGKAISVKVSFTDDADNAETLTSVETDAAEPGTEEAKPNTPATGAPAIIGTVQVGKTLTADASGIADADGLGNTVFSHQWQADGADITGATDSTYSLVATDQGKTIKVKVSFTDDRGNQETLTSEATAAVASQGTCPVGGYNPVMVEVEVEAVPIVVDSTTDEYFVLYVRPDLDSDREVPVSVTLGEDGATTLTEQLPALPKEHYRVEKFLIAAPADVDGDCIDDVTELADPVGMNPLNPAPAIRLVDGAVAIPDRETFEALSYKGKNVLVDIHLTDLEFVKFFLVGMDTARPVVYFMNTETHRAHGHFFGAIDLSSHPLWNREGRMRGEIIHHPNVVAPDGSLGVYRYEFEPWDSYSFEAVAYSYEVLAASMPLLDNNLAYYPMPMRALPRYHRERELYDDSRINVLLEEDVFPDVDFIPLNREEGYGFLRVMSLEERPNPRDIVIYETLPNELPRVAGIITTVPQTPLSHVNLRAVQDAVPNAFIRDALDNADIDDLIGGYVRYTVAEDGWTLRAATPAEVDAHYASSRPATGQTPERDLSVTEITPLRDTGFGDWTAFGVKAANVAVLGTLGFPEDTVPDGFAAPFYFYDEFMKHNELYDDIEEMLADPDFQTDYDTQEAELKKLRKKIKKADTPEWIIEALEEMHATYPEGQSLRYRSSTNNEDLPGFSGAGLYDSKTQHPEETAEDGISKSLKQVYASLWNFRAFTEREFHRVDHLAAAMGVLVHPNYSDELANGVAVSFDPIRGGSESYYVNTQIGEDLVTNPEARSVPEEVLLHPDGTYTVAVRSNQVPPGQLLMSEAQLDQLRRHLQVIHDEFEEMYGIDASEKFAMEIEFKITRDNILSIKQARPWVFIGTEAPPAEDLEANGPAREWTENWLPGREPTNLRGEATDAGIVMTWDAPRDAADEVTGYQVWRWRPFLDEVSHMTVYVDDTGSAATTYTDTDVVDGEHHSYQVRAIRGLELSADSNYLDLLGKAVTAPQETPAANSPATGAPTISGGARVGETLTAETSGIADADGLTNVTFSYQWLSGGDTEIRGATNATYTLAAADLGKTIAVRVSFTDDAGHAETLTSAATAAVAEDPALAMVWSGALAVGENDAGAVGYSLWGGGFGSLTDPYFEVRGNRNEVKVIGHRDDALYLVVAEALPWEFTLRIGGTEYDGGDNGRYGGGGYTYRWPEPTLPFTVGETVAVSLLRAVEPNSPATGALTVTGTAQVGEMLTADTSGIADTDGLTNATFSYQWEADGTDLVGATASTYTPVVDDIGKAISVRVSFTDDAGNEESVTSAATDAVGPGTEEAKATNSPATGLPTINGTAQVGETLTVDTSSIADEDGLDNTVYTYQWISNDGGTDSEIVGATGSTYTLAAVDEGKAIKVRVNFTDDAGNVESLTSVATAEVAAKPNSPATGAPTISGTAQVGETLTADTSGIADADGLANVTYSYQWVVNEASDGAAGASYTVVVAEDGSTTWVPTDGTADADIEGATGPAYTLTEASAGRPIRVRVSFTDGGGNAETVISAPTLMAGMYSAPVSHDGESVFTFELRFSEEFGIGYKTLRDHAFTVTGGTVKKAQRLEQDSNIGWRITVQPSGSGDVTITLPETTDCNAQGAICTGDGRMLSNRLELTVSGPGQ